MLKNIVIQNKTVEVEYPYVDVTDKEFTVDIAYLTKDAVLSLKKKSTKLKKDKYSRVPTESFDEDKFTELFIEATIIGWSNFTYGILAQMLPTDPDLIRKDLGLSPEEDPLVVEIPFSLEDANFLIRNSIEFDNWISEISNDLDVFTKAK